MLCPGATRPKRAPHQPNVESNSTKWKMKSPNWATCWFSHRFGPTKSRDYDPLLSLTQVHPNIVPNPQPLIPKKGVINFALDLLLKSIKAARTCLCLLLWSPILDLPHFSPTTLIFHVKDSSWYFCFGCTWQRPSSHSHQVYILLFWYGSMLLLKGLLVLLSIGAVSHVVCVPTQEPSGPGLVVLPKKKPGEAASP